MTLLFLSLAAIIAVVVILVSAKHIKAGFEARGDVKEQQKSEKRKQEDEKILDELNSCLLYTSPSPRDATLSRMPSSA